MSLIYNLKREDLLIYYRKILKEESLFHKPYIFLIALLVALVQTINRPEYVNVHFLIQYLIYFLILTAIIFLIRDKHINHYKRTIRLNPSLLGNRKIKLDLNEINLKTDYITATYSIHVIKRIEEVLDYYYVYIDPIIVIIIPKNIDGSKQFIEELNSLINN